MTSALPYEPYGFSVGLMCLSKTQVSNSCWVKRGLGIQEGQADGAQSVSFLGLT